jgi:predicted alpha/beta-fold hydrolase
MADIRTAQGGADPSKRLVIVIVDPSPGFKMIPQPQGAPPSIEQNVALAFREDRSPVVFRPPFVLRHRHVQSILPSWPGGLARVRRRAAAMLEAAEASILDCGDGVRLQGWFSGQRGLPRGIVLMLHGWEGSAESSYVLSSAAALHAAGFAILRLNFRDHGGTQALNPGLFNSCLLDEVVGAVRAMHKAFAFEPCFIVGFSLGGNFALRIARRADSAGLSLRRVVAVCPVLRPHSTMHALEQGLFVYRAHFLRRWRASLRAKAQCFPELYDFGDLALHRTLTATTAHCVENYSAFADLDSYLEGYAITGSVLEGLRVPSHVILAEDDPIIPIGDVALLAKPAALSITRSRHGGHCGFVADFALNRWLDEQLVSELAASL